MTNEILIVDDNNDIRLLISSILKDKGFSIREASSFTQAIEEINKKLPDVAIIDVKLDKKGDKDGIDILTHIKKINDNLPVIMISGHANVQMAVDSLKLGAFEFMQKPFSSERLLNFVNRAIENLNLKKEKSILEGKLFHSFDFIGESPQILKVKNLINKLGNTESRVFISGPAGSGKELVARQIHKKSSRSNKPFVIVNGALLDPAKYEFELFGSENSDGTVSNGFFEKARDGTLLIDEVSEIPLETQSKILRVLIDQKFKRINGNHDINVNVRIICSSSKNIKNEILSGNFREDLFHRLNVFQIDVEPLNKRVSDIPLLIDYFSKKISESYNLKKFNIDTNNHYLINYYWPGNVRELRNLIERIAILAPENEEKISGIIKESLKSSELDNKKIENSLSVPLKVARENFEKDYLTTQLKKFAGNISKTAKFVGMERSALHRKLKGLGVKDLN